MKPLYRSLPFPEKGELKEPTGFMSDPQKSRETIFNYKLTVKIYIVNSLLRRTFLGPALSVRLIENQIKGVKKGRDQLYRCPFYKGVCLIGVSVLQRCLSYRGGRLNALNVLTW